MKEAFLFILIMIAIGAGAAVVAYHSPLDCDASCIAGQEEDN